MREQSLYERLGGAYAIAAVVDHFSDQLLKNTKVVNSNPELKEWHTEKYRERMPGLKFLRTLWVCAVAGGPFQYTAKELGDALVAASGRTSSGLMGKLKGKLF